MDTFVKKQIVKEIFRGRYFRLAVIFLVIPVLLFFLLRGFILDYTLERIKEKIGRKYGAAFVYSRASFEGIANISMENTGVLTPDGDTLFFMNKISAGIRLLPLAGGKIRLSALEGSGGKINLISNGKRNTYSWLIPKEKQRKETPEEMISSPDYPALLDHLRSTLFESVPDLVRLSNLSAIFNKDTLETRMKIPIALLEDGFFSARLKGEDNLGKFEWSAAGEIDPSSGVARVVFYPVGKTPNRIPFTGSWMKLKAGLDTLEIKLNESGLEDTEFKIKGRMHLKGFWVNHWRLAPTEVKIGQASMNYSIGISDQVIKLDTSSTASINKLLLKLGSSYVYSPEKKYQLNLSIPEIASQDFFLSLPSGLFSNLEGLQSKGLLSYSLQFYLDSRQPDSVIFKSNLHEKQFVINSFGKESPLKLNGEFNHEVYEKGQMVKQFVVGPSNPDFIPIAEIPTILIQSVLSSEDGNFFTHRGFNQEAFRKSIAENYRKGKFARGGSTISMQLVKNVFLTRNKTIARKIEEALLVWLIEEHQLVSKSRMLEVYLNIIEWGPGIYGIGSASKFYFNKKPSALSLEECIFLAMIIPRPKGFSYHFDPEGKLKEYTSGYFNLLGSLLYKKGIIDSTQKNLWTGNLTINGPAKNLLLHTDSFFTQDSTIIENQIIDEMEQ